jgi:TPR repeat protein
MALGREGFEAPLQNGVAVPCRAAQAGLHSAQYVVGNLLLGTDQRPKGLRWLAMAADTGQHDAQIAPASELLAGGNPDDVTRARALLENAVQAGTVEATYQRADLLSATSLRDEIHVGRSIC